MLSRLKGALVRTIFLPDWKVKVTVAGRFRLARLMDPELDKPVAVRPRVVIPSALLVPGVFVRRSR